MNLEHFVKRNNTKYADALLKEAKGLKAIQSILDTLHITEIKVPEIIRVSENELVLEHIPSTNPTREHMQHLGDGLAKLHKYSDKHHYGLSYNNYIGLNPQVNSEAESWGRFFVEQRLEFQIGLIRDTAIKTRFENKLETSKAKLIEQLDKHCDKTSLCHGDLWSGNILFSKDQCWLIDPAIYWGDREVDLAMSEMFGGFSPVFYQSYDRAYPRSAAYSHKKDIYNLYHYLNHYNLFGEGYLRDCERILFALTGL